MKKVILITMLVLALLFAFVGCAKTDTVEDTTEDTTQDTTEDVAQDTTEDTTGDATEEDTTQEEAEAVVIKVAGSTSVGPVIEALAEKYTAANPNVTINVEQTGSGAGVTSCGDGTADMGMASRDVKDEEMELYPDMNATVLCLDGVVVVVSADSPVTELTVDQVKDIFMGEITDWSEVGGDAGPITLYSRDSVSGTREAFQKLFLGKDDAGEEIEIEDTMCIIVSSNGDMGQAIQDDATGIGYMSLGIAPEYNVTSLTIDGAVPTTDNLVSGDYPYFRNFNLLTMGVPAGDVADFMEYCLNNDEAKEYMTGKGYVLAE